MNRDVDTYPLRISRHLKNAAALTAKEEGTSFDQFVATAIAEKVSALNTESFFSERRKRADFGAFLKILNREGGEPPREGDEVRFPFGDREAIEALAVNVYWRPGIITPEEKEAEINRIPGIVKSAQGRGCLYKDEFIELGRWKSPRPHRWYKENSKGRVTDLTRKALSASDREEALEHLDALKGVALPTASAILHWFRDDTPIIDFRVVEALGYGEIPDSKFKNYKFYNEVAKKVIQEAERVNVSLRDMDRALWAWQKAYGRPRKRHTCA